MFVTSTAIGQVDSTVSDSGKPAKKELKNTISYNITNTLLFGGNSQVICYERVTGKHQSASIEVGSFSFPKLQVLSGKYRTNEGETQKGYKIAVDYRFYPANENKYNAPRGVYVGPYASFNYFNREKSFSFDTSSTNVSAEITVNTDFTFQTVTGGLQLGYQFVFWRRLAVDLILIGPGITAYRVKAKLDTSLDADEESELFTAINDKLAEKIPGYSYVIKPVEFESSGTTNTTSIGFRYLIHVGFRF